MAAAAAAAADRRLLLASFAAAPAGSDATTPGSPDAALALIQQGEYAGALAATLRAAWAAAAGGSASPESTPDWFEAASAAFMRLLLSGCSPEAQAAAARQLLLAAVAALHLFGQANLVGPTLRLPECPFDWIDEAAAAEWQADAEARQPDDSSPSEGPGFGRDSTSPGDRWAGTQLSESGEDLIGRIQYPQYLLLAKTILLAPLAVLPAAPDASGAVVAGAAARVEPAAGAEAWLPQQLPSWHWWATRAVLLQQRLLSGRSAALRSLLLGLEERALATFAQPVEASIAARSSSSSSDRSGSSIEDQLLAAGALLEAALLEAAYGHVDSAQQYLQRSSDVLGFHSELTGALGMRTVHQQEAKAQLLVSITRQAGNPWTAAHAAGALPDAAEPRGALEAATTGQVELPAELKGFTADSDVLPHPRLVEGPEASAAAAAAHAADLHSLEQALLLGWCLHVRKGSAADGLQPWEMAAYVDALARQERTQFLLHAAATLQASRLEKARSRTRDRALLQMEQLTESIGKASADLPPQLRMRYAFSVWFPLQVSLQKELGELLVGLGLVGSALQLFEGLELWENLIVCYQLLDKRVQAEELIKRRLEVTPDEPRLWCALGDLCLDDAHYLQAWERSGHRNARAQRSLARNALRNSNYVKAAGHWEAALALNPLHGEGWFSLGYCYIKEKEYPAALRAFTRISQLEPENGEAWNNLAAIHMHLKHWKQGYNALSEAVKHKRDSWQTWENYAQVAVRVQQWQTAVRALQKVLVLSAGKRVDLEVVAAVVGQVEAGRGLGGASQQQPEQQPSAADSGGDAAAAAEGSGAPAADADGAAGEQGSGLEELAAAFGELSAANESGAGGAETAAAAAAAADAAAETQQKADARGQEILEQAVGGLMKQVAGSISGDSAFWEIYARFQTGMGYPDAAKECLLKRVRALGGAGWQASQDKFETYAHASLALCRAYLQAAQAGGSDAQRELSSARLHLRGLIKQSQERYEEHEAFQQLQQLLQSVEEEQQKQ